MKAISVIAERKEKSANVSLLKTSYSKHCMAGTRLKYECLGACDERCRSRCKRAMAASMAEIQPLFLTVLNLPLTTCNLSSHRHIALCFGDFGVPLG